MDGPNYGERFDGDVYVPALDDERLTGQLGRIFELMRDGEWRTTFEIHDETGDPQASILAQLGHLRKERFGSFLVEKRRRTLSGTWEYRVGGKGEGTPHPRSCARCQVLEREIERLKAQIAAQPAQGSLF